MENGGGEAIYLFCFARSIPDQVMAGADGIDHHPLFLHRFADIAAILSKVPLEDFCGPEASARMQDLNWIGPRVCRHEKAVEQAMRYSPVLPARFGTLFSSLDSLEKLAETHHQTISRFLDQVADKEEWAIKGLLDRDKAKEKFISLSLSGKSGHLDSLPPGMRYLQQQRIRAGVEKELNSWVKKICEGVENGLSNYASEVCKRKVFNLEAAGGAKDMILNWAFLVPRKAREDFSARIDRENADRLDCGLAFELSGPWPPYSFAPSLELGPGT
ncbi:MAG: GvpL/GvpF family gas vesicle protein [Proteobacteria bacterium]|nr:GvpL/GvpF family gas vesicle protein [Pseudomonadota bacterium]